MERLGEVSAKSCKESARYDLFTQTGYHVKSVWSLQEAVGLSLEKEWLIFNTRGDMVVDY